MRRAHLEALLSAREAKRAMVVATWLEGGRQQLVDPRAPTPPVDVAPAVFAAARQACRDDRSTTIESEGGEVFLHVFNPPARLVVVGAVHIAQPLVAMARQVDFDVVVIDPRQAFATAERFPGVRLLTEWPDKALAGLEPDDRTAVVTLTHDPKLDDPALAEALGSDAFLIGALGSRRTHAKRLARLRERGFGDEQLARIKGPVGLSIGARTPAEIAVAVLAQVVASLRGESA